MGRAPRRVRNESETPFQDRRFAAIVGRRPSSNDHEGAWRGACHDAHRPLRFSPMSRQPAFTMSTMVVVVGSACADISIIAT
jgi:hypothetical protein